jgi:hypothetical protein
MKRTTILITALVFALAGWQSIERFHVTWQGVVLLALAFLLMMFAFTDDQRTGEIDWSKDMRGLDKEIDSEEWR